MIENMEKLLSDGDKRLLKEIFEPKVVACPLSDSRRDLMVMPNGEIRDYGEIRKPRWNIAGDKAYLSSFDCGLSWKLKEVPSDVLGACVYDKKRERFITVKSDDSATYVYFSEIGPDDTVPKKLKICDLKLNDIYQPKFLKCGIIATTAFYFDDNSNYHPVFIVSYDGGENWEYKIFNSAPSYEPTWPDIDVRWENNGSECIITEFGDYILLLARTSQNYFYQYLSYDLGKTWSEAEKSRFHGTLTTPFFLEMSSGRTLLFFNNTQPMPEMCHALANPKLDSSVSMRLAEDVFTNRDAAHCAYSDNGNDWFGFREIALSAIRNNHDFRTLGGCRISQDKSVHQFQAVELPFGKVLVCAGQHDVSVKMFIFDPKFLEEKQRHEDFQNGLSNISTQVYVKSVLGHTNGMGIMGHCQYNRTNGALLMPDGYGEALGIVRLNDPRLLSERTGAVWNFASAECGVVSIKMKFAGEGVRISLCDRWFSPIDESVREFANFYFEIGPETFLNQNQDGWFILSVEFDTKKGFAIVKADGEKLFRVKMKNECENGISYLHLQSNAEHTDYNGTLIKWLDFKGE